MTLLQLLPERVLGAAVSTQARRVPVLVLSSAKARSAMEDRSPSLAYDAHGKTADLSRDAPEDMPSRGRKTRRGSPGAGSLVEDGDLPFRANSRGEDSLLSASSARILSGVIPVLSPPRVLSCRRVWRFPRRPPGGESWRTVFAGHGMRHLAELYDSSEAPSEERREKEAKLNWFALGRVVDQNRGRHLAGYTVPYKFRIIDPISVARSVPKNLGQLNRRTQTGDQYVDFSQNRFPVLNTAENFRYWKDRGLDRLLPRVFPIKLPAHRRVDPLLREYIYFLHSMDPARFSTRKLGERYGLKERTVELICREFSVAEFLRRTELATPYTRRVSREKAVLRTKEALFSLKLGYDQLGDEDLDEQEEHEFRGFRSTQDWIQRQNIEVEMMSAFPLPAKRDPVPKRVDVDLTVHNTAKLKVMNWIDPNDKVVF
ncbi:hypothetical protein NCLIV_052040 [Neospora caninum Liverpool]|uniref:Uncharacterized protein n=1 Tax=Neospora caninum (strain Liverpool) TaxID=572307 RepID=F0VL26_NEOCL|nr:hypothetical protein NCLIV_052040 [Neospora caninum Liverpool]CBZ54778.1 hypothetical protein NCLIV_052040 [Neospora caninum Liverpool]|eukprot:XP_003884806.1 hypothetical protein NCLIV_052040 [Neospora caninum Liverpool]